MIIKKVRGKNFFNIGNAFLEIDLLKYDKNVISGKNGSGKCLTPRTKINIQIKDLDVYNTFLEFMETSKEHK